VECIWAGMLSVSKASICRYELNARSAEEKKLQELHWMFTVLQNQPLTDLKQSGRYLGEFYFQRFN